MNVEAGTEGIPYRGEIVVGFRVVEPEELTTKPVVIGVNEVDDVRHGDSLVRLYGHQGVRAHRPGYRGATHGKQRLGHFLCDDDFEGTRVSRELDMNPVLLV